MCVALDCCDTVGMVGQISNYVSGAQLIPDLEFSAKDEIEAFSDRRYAEHRGRFAVTERLVGFCVLIRDVAVSTVGLFDEQLGIDNYGDDDYGLRVRKAGFELRIALDSFVFHFGSGTLPACGFAGKRGTHCSKALGFDRLEYWS